MMKKMMSREKTLNSVKSDMMLRYHLKEWIADLSHVTLVTLDTIGHRSGGTVTTVTRVTPKQGGVE